MTLEQNTMLKYGKNAGLLMIIWELLIVVFEWGSMAAGKYGYFLNLTFLLGATLLALRTIEPHYKDAEPPFKTRFGVGLGVGLVAATLYFVATLIIYKIIFTDYPQQIIKQIDEIMLAERRTDAYIAHAHQNIQYNYGFVGLCITNFVATMAQSLFLSALVAGALRNTRGMFDKK
jgi:hypothetical protein